MNARQRATLAFRILGVYYVAAALPYAGRFAQFLLAKSGLADALPHYPGYGPGVAGGCVGLGALFLLCARWLSRLVTRALGKDGNPVAEAAALAAVLLGTLHLSSMVFVLQFALLDGWPGSYFSIAVPAAVGAALIVGAPPLVQWAKARSRPHLDAPTAAFATLFVGLLFICLGPAYRTFMGLVGTFTMPADFLSAGEQRALLAQQVTSGGVVVMMIVVCVGFIAEIASRGARRGPSPPGDRVLPAPAGPWVWLTAALLLCVFRYVLLAVRALFDLCPIGWSVPGVVARVVWGVFATGLVGCAVAFIWGPMARWLAARIYSPPADGGARRASGRLILEAGITLLVLWHVVSRAFSIHLAQSPYGVVKWFFWSQWRHWLAPALTLILLAFRGDIARIWMPGPAPEGPPTGQHRAAALHPWLVLLGVWTLFRSVPTAAIASLQLATGIPLLLEPIRPMVLVRVALGIILVALTGPLSRLLSFGPILLRKRTEAPA
ncbi:MAG: hypothetical protein R6V05_12690 [Candidatus Brocadiia bacterium]